MIRAIFPSCPLGRGLSLAVTMLSGAALLSACSILPSQTPVDTYALTALLPAQTLAARRSARMPLALRITRPLVSGALSGRRIVVMPEPGRVSVYQGAVWSEPPAQLLRDQMIDAFLADGRLESVITDEGVMPHADYLLSTQLRGFHSAYEQGNPQAVIRVDAQIIDARSNRIVASRSFLAQQPAADKQVPGVVQAINQATDQLVQDMVDWTIQQIGAR